MSEYSDIVLDHAENPRNQGVLEDGNARGYQMNPVCGDVLVLTLRIDNGRVDDIRFQTEGCTASVAASSLITEMAKGLSLADAKALSHEDVSREIGGLPPSKLHSAALVIDALRRAIAAYEAGGAPAR